ncbi:nucleoside diphosphate kinase regulator [Opitutus sp. ER46]|uniref:nucleoside diphosphate kinase regulator n=1 Tax=Opitutus sp. ER46 TaxID=2161864 RepID=UPI000D326757|nr:nucleoside diphosphate kinase regulator [Opitutus sp. ER46]PTX92354.1 nucleoside diphosphate kinase regulator [Opitutus sp. ER46]
MSDTPLYLATTDHARLRQLLASLGSSRTATLEQLQRELDRAVVLDPAAIPPHVVVMGSTVEVEDQETGEVDTYTLVYPERADIEKGQLSVLAPIGTALIGFPRGTEIAWQTPGGTRRLLIRSVTPPVRHAAPELLPTR